MLFPDALLLASLMNLSKESFPGGTPQGMNGNYEMFLGKGGLSRTSPGVQGDWAAATSLSLFLDSKSFLRRCMLEVRLAQGRVETIVACEPREACEPQSFARPGQFGKTGWGKILDKFPPLVMYPKMDTISSNIYLLGQENGGIAQEKEN